MRPVERTLSTPRQAVLGALAAAVVSGAVWGLGHAVAALVEAIAPSPDANIGLGMFLLALQTLVVPFGMWWPLRLLGVPGAGLVAGGAVVVLVVVVTSVGVLASVVVVTAYTGLAVLTARALAARRHGGLTSGGAA
ncbi:hypothetical protein BDK92_0033 [Micromonospora pisi]|uniref:Uncharacterized protein n=1 Tax=Micromonospora pisi TaxID=589240 RepID=A0A495JBQ9_9ACTN|nr:hypothetical protein [Micromonospora pisi]RKR85824.1 hypothetical protein BDK92_0033 [Micromonospora pisi]